MSTELYKFCIKVAACICARDGVISEAEERAMFELLAEHFPDVDEAMFDRALDEFFDSKGQLEDYLRLVDDRALREFTLHLAAGSAAADGLDIRENIALQKACEIWGLRLHV